MSIVDMVGELARVMAENAQQSWNDCDQSEWRLDAFAAILTIRNMMIKMGAEKSALHMLDAALIAEDPDVFEYSDE